MTSQMTRLDDCSTKQYIENLDIKVQFEHESQERVDMTRVKLKNSF